MRHYSIALIPGDGVGIEVIREGKKVLDTVCELDGSIRFDYEEFDWSCTYYLKHGKMMPDDGLDILKKFDAIYLGAVGYPNVPDHISLWGLLMPIRQRFQQYINLRPVRLLRGLTSPLEQVKELDFVVIRENNEGEYAQIGGRMHEGTNLDMAIQTSVFTKLGVERVLHYAYNLANERKKKLTAATKSNGMIYTMPFWDEYVKKINEEFQDVETTLTHIDALCAFFVTKPETFDVVVASNLFGDILTDLGAAIVGGLGVAPSANINPEKHFPSMFEPVHGSAPDIAGKNIANPTAAIWCASLMLEHVGEEKLAAVVMEALQDVLEERKVITPDLGGKGTTEQFGTEVCEKLNIYF